MFICGSCGRTTEPGEPCKQVVVEWRTKEYPAVQVMGEADRFGIRRPRYGKPGKGFEAVRTIKACHYCVERNPEAPRPETAKSELSTESTGLSTAPRPHKYIRQRPETASPPFVSKADVALAQNDVENARISEEAKA